MNVLSLKKSQRGLSVVELMIALVLGLILMTGIIQVFLTSRLTYATNEAMGRLQENGRFALDFISRNARNAGYIDPINLANLPDPLPRSNCSDICLGDDTGTNTDRITFAMQPVLQDGNRYSCSGDLVTTANAVIYNSFYVENGSLWCNWGEVGQPKKTAKEIVSGIDSLRVLYGVSASTNSSSASQYVPASRVSDWSLVRSVRIAVLANSVEKISPAPAGGLNYYLLDAPPVNQGNDGLARQIFSTTIQLKNI
ncbi:PilW family protein [Atopomonas sediminilitoris]|uniref:PilW family protein n=1 Tax=Atopomonas sediminilitoris TaxID=2919919 RepID=UPI002342EBAE|nr:PilW family protein [Atopomonas sediminilitoris]